MMKIATAMPILSGMQASIDSTTVAKGYKAENSIQYYIAWIDGENVCNDYVKTSKTNEGLCDRVFKLRNGYSYMFKGCGINDFAVYNSNGIFNYYYNYDPKIWPGRLRRSGSAKERAVGEDDRERVVRETGPSQVRCKYTPPEASYSIGTCGCSEEPNLISGYPCGSGGRFSRTWRPRKKTFGVQMGAAILLSVYLAFSRYRRTINDVMPTVAGTGRLIHTSVHSAAPSGQPGGLTRLSPTVRM